MSANSGKLDEIILNLSDNYDFMSKMNMLYELSFCHSAQFNGLIAEIAGNIIDLTAECTCN